MPDYTTVDRIHTKVPYIGSLSNLSSADTVTFIDDAEARINAKLVPYYTIPVQSAALLQALATDGAICLILGQRVFTQERQNQSEWVSEFCRAFTMVDKIAKGEIPLVDSSGTLISRRTDVVEVWSNTMGYTPTFNVDDMTKHEVDPDRLDDIDSDRD